VAHGKFRRRADILQRDGDFLAGLGVDAVFLEVDENNAPARRLYRKAGFTEVGGRKAYYQEGASAVVLRRDLG